jgi:hypothetical protein
MSAPIATLQKNSFQEIRVELNEFRGYDLIDLRVWAEPRDGGSERIPTKAAAPMVHSGQSRHRGIIRATTAAPMVHSGRSRRRLPPLTITAPNMMPVSSAQSPGDRVRERRRPGQGYRCLLAGIRAGRPRRTEAGSKGQTSIACDSGVYSLH